MPAIFPGLLIVQTWRGSDWKRSEAGSILVLAFSRAGRIALVHANVPVRHQAGVRNGWPTSYWRPWQRYIGGHGGRRRRRG